MSADPQADFRRLVHYAVERAARNGADDQSYGNLTPEDTIVASGIRFAALAADRAIDALLADPGALAARQRLAAATAERTRRPA